MKNYVFTSESVTEGHPDKLCDYISDSLLDEYLKQDKDSRVAVETFATKNKIVISGEVTSNARFDIEEVVRSVIKEVGYDNEETGMDYRTCKIDTNITCQSNDIAKGVDAGGAGDQGIMFGYACNETEEYMPLAINLAHKLARKLADVRKSGIIPYLQPDGKTQVTIEYEGDFPKRADTILISSQHLDGIDIEVMKSNIINRVIKEVVPEKYLDENTKFIINPTGRFVVGGPLADTGLTGRKIIMDTYGGYAHHGGGAFSGKDATKVDRSAAYMLRYIAKNIVANGLALKCEIQVAYAIGVAKPVSMFINTFNTNKIPEMEIIKFVNENYDLTPKGIIETLDLKNPVYRSTTNYGHFGKNGLNWEKGTVPKSH